MYNLQFNVAVLGEFLRGDKLVRMLSKVGFNCMQKHSAIAFTPTRDELDVFWEYAGSCYFHLIRYPSVIHTIFIDCRFVRAVDFYCMINPR